MTPDPAYWGRLLGGLSIETCLLLLVAALVERAFRSPARRRMVWQTVILATGLLWAGELCGARGLLAFPGAAQPVPRRVSVQSVVPPPTAESPEGREDEPVVGTTDVRRGTWWPGWIWLGGAVMLTARGLAAWGWLASRRRRGVAVDVETRGVVNRLSAALELRRVQVRTWPGLRGPLALGWVRPEIALPVTFAARFDPLQRQAILAHELAHLARRDPFWLFLTDQVRALAWWHPGVWWARRRLQAEMEAAADEASALVPGGGRALAESLLVFGRELATPGSLRGLGVSGAGLKSDLARRVAALLAPSAGPGGRGASRGRPWISPVIALGCAGAVLGVGWPGDDHKALGALLLAETRAGALEGGAGGPDAQARVEAVLDPLKVRPESAASGTTNALAATGPDSAPVVILEMKIFQVTEGKGGELGLDWLVGEAPTNNPPMALETPTGDLPGAGSGHAENIRIERSRLEGQTVTLGPSQARALIRKLESREGYESIAVPRVSTRSGRQAQVQVQSMRTLVTGVEAGPKTGANPAGIAYQTQTIPLGPTVDVTPLLVDGAWEVWVKGRLSEFLGYDDPEREKDPDARPRADVVAGGVHGVQPLPRLRVREVIGRGRLAPGETLLLCGPAAEEPVRVKRGWFRPASLETQRRRLYVMVTPTSAP